MKTLRNGLLLAVLAGLLLQLYFVARIAAMNVVDPQSTAFERSEAWRIATEKGQLPWRQQWMPYEKISSHLKRAVIASEDDGFANHDGVDWDALEKAWQKNTKAEERAAQAQERLSRAQEKAATRRPGSGQNHAPGQAGQSPQSSRWLHHYPTARQEPVPVG
jgi:monofunctional biosynthetic peptidoglycan transglycosylase